MELMAGLGLATAAGLLVMLIALAGTAAWLLGRRRRLTP